MSESYWICEGIGVKASDVEPYLNTEKCIKLLKEQFPDEPEPEKDNFDIRDYLYGEPFENIAEILYCCDDTNALVWNDNNHGESYLLYAPSYPWEMTNNEPKNRNEVHERIIKTVQKICDMTDEQIEKIIDDDIYEVGWG